MGPGEPREPHDEGARRPREDDEDFGFNDPAFNDPQYSSNPQYSADAEYAGYDGKICDTRK